jgi:hypothetical protein
MYECLVPLILVYFKMLKVEQGMPFHKSRSQSLIMRVNQDLNIDLFRNKQRNSSFPLPLFFKEKIKKKKPNPS